MDCLDWSTYDARVLKSLLRPLLRKGVPVRGVPLSSTCTIPWHLTVEECRRVLRQKKAHSHDLLGFPTARIRWKQLETRATFEFVEGEYLDGDWLTGGAELVLHGPDGKLLLQKPRLPNLRFPRHQRW